MMREEEDLSDESGSYTGSDALEDLPLEGDFLPIWRKLRDILRNPQPKVTRSLDYPQLTDMVKTSRDVDLRPNTVVLRIYPIVLFHDVTPLPPLSENRKSVDLL